MAKYFGTGNTNHASVTGLEKSRGAILQNGMNPNPKTLY